MTTRFDHLTSHCAYFKVWNRLRLVTFGFFAMVLLDSDFCFFPGLNIFQVWLFFKISLQILLCSSLSLPGARDYNYSFCQIFLKIHLIWILELVNMKETCCLSTFGATMRIELKCFDCFYQFDKQKIFLHHAKECFISDNYLPSCDNV